MIFLAPKPDAARNVTRRVLDDDACRTNPGGRGNREIPAEFLGTQNKYPIEVGALARSESGGINMTLRFTLALVLPALVGSAVFVRNAESAEPMCRANNGTIFPCRLSEGNKKSIMPGSAGPGPAPSYIGPAPSYAVPAPSYLGPAPSYNGPAPFYAGGGGPVQASVCMTNYGPCGLSAPQYQGQQCSCDDGTGSGNYILGLTQ